VPIFPFRKIFFPIVMSGRYLRLLRTARKSRSGRQGERAQDMPPRRRTIEQAGESHH
jgi:hypothetical protein